MTKQNNSRAQIVATIGPSCSTEKIILEMIEHNMDVARLNFSWGNIEERVAQIGLIRKAAAKCGRHIPIIQDLPGPRIQKKDSHTYDHHAASALTENDKQSIVFGVGQELEYIALSFVANARDIEECRKVIVEHGGKQMIIAKIERRIALENLGEIVAVADAIMVARGDLGDDIPLEQVPFAQARIIESARKAHKPVITATQMMLSMVNNPLPTRAEVTDVANAILQGSDAVMLSEESALGKYPVEAVTMMEKIVLEAEKHLSGRIQLNLL